ncbi:MAG: hypothetical protein APG12_00876 [Candidatus Methanofastidiosum methylothiophilum]|uniref:Thioredoxin domain-containing protein n=1 Tax=Candidatus Methanofastidiosum methylothiophilum TaxID=1705564 RepID=A0A150IJJ2_9EURY|nr:MAG: hypothetical protein APG10_01071 [Candidatus Methanofastidiosum methylthiophilus]KYC47254.1 MAG: hypothetical protein APG11_01297 [Candidatus Methanofastidiosum methylthiophilus]KYC50348.1 MAG: hypothetical protein APG12_00876 [Candidatus Methanofastidiosum methylthiophilus]
MKVVSIIAFIMAFALLISGIYGFNIGPVSIEGRQYQQANQIGSYICLSCLGLTGSRVSHALTEDTINRLKRIDYPVKIWVFTSNDCPTCPDAKAIILNFTLENSNITYEEIKLETQGQFFDTYSVSELPTVIFFNKDGVVLRKNNFVHKVVGIDKLQEKIIEAIETVS